MPFCFIYLHFTPQWLIEKESQKYAALSAVSEAATLGTLIKIHIMADFRWSQRVWEKTGVPMQAHYITRVSNKSIYLNVVLQRKEHFLKANL